MIYPQRNMHIRQVHTKRLIVEHINFFRAQGLMLLRTSECGIGLLCFLFDLHGEIIFLQFSIFLSGKFQLQKLPFSIVYHKDDLYTLWREYRYGISPGESLFMLLIYE